MQKISSFGPKMGEKWLFEVFLTLSAFFNLILKMGTKAYTWSKWPWFQKNLYFLRLVYQINQFFALIENPLSKIATNAYFGHQRAAKLSHRELKTFKWPFLVYFCLDWFLLLWGPLLGLTDASDQIRLKFVKFCFLDLNLPCFEPLEPSWKIFKEKKIGMKT